MATPKGVSGNPTGRPKHSGEWAAAIYQVLLEEDPKTRKRKIRQAAERLVKEAINGNIEALKVIGDRIDGKSIQAIDMKLDATVNIAEKLERRRRKAGLE